MLISLLSDDLCTYILKAGESLYIFNSLHNFSIDVLENKFKPYCGEISSFRWFLQTYGWKKARISASVLGRTNHFKSEHFVKYSW